MPETILYELPLNERTRNFMRLENYFLQINYFSNRGAMWDSQACLITLIDILNILDRNDIRSELSKEIERYINTLKNLVDEPAVNTQQLQNILDQLHTQLFALQSISGKVTRSLREDDLLNTVRQRIGIPANLNNFEVPVYYWWLNQPTALRQQHMQKWLQELTVIEDGIILITELLRSSANFETVTSVDGFYQRSLNPQQTCQMIRIELPDNAAYFPETSGGKHRINVRFLNIVDTKQRPTTVDKDVVFAISCCGL